MISSQYMAYVKLVGFFMHERNDKNGITACVLEQATTAPSCDSKKKTAPSCVTTRTSQAGVVGVHPSMPHLAFAFRSLAVAQIKAGRGSSEFFVLSICSCSRTQPCALALPFPSDPIRSDR
jgi:hypothetical protein